MATTRPPHDRRRALVPRALRADARARRALHHDLRRAGRAALHGTRTCPTVDEIGLPGEFPYTRGVYPSMYRGRLWTMRQFAGFGTAEETNERFRYLLEHGQTGLSTAFDMPSLMGHDSDHPRSRGRGRPRGRGDRHARRHGDALPGHPDGRGLHVDDDQRARRRSCSPSTSSPPSARACRPSSWRARSRPTSSRSTSPRRSGASRSTRPCAWSPT